MHSWLKRLNHRLIPTHLLHGPEWLVLGVNNVCNLNCKMCDVGLARTDTNFARNLTGTHPLNMPLPLINEILAQAAKFYPSVKVGYAFTEPLIYPHLGESLREARRKRLFTSVTTNGLNLARKANELVDAGLNDLYVSLDGLEATHNFIRGHRKSFQSALEGIETLVYHNEGQRPGISVFCVITEWNLTELKRFADRFSEFPLKQLGFLHPNYTTLDVAAVHNARFGDRYPATQSNVGEMSPETIDLDALGSEIERIRATDYPFPVTFSPDLKHQDDLMKFYRQPGLFIGTRCNDVFTNIMIKSDGSVIPAHGRCYRLTVGNLHQQDLREIWDSPTLERLRQDLRKAGGLFPACSRCCSAF